MTASDPSGANRRFLSDDPIAREPDTQDAAGVEEWEIDLFIDLSINLFGRPGDSTPDVRAGNINTVDEVPDSSWFTNRILARPVTAAEIARGPLTGSGPAPGRWNVVSPKLAGFAPGFTMVDSRGERWFVSFDAAGQPEAATGAIAVANKIFWALGYWQVENYLVSIRRDELDIADKATFTPMSYFATDATGTRVKPTRLALGCVMDTTLATCAARILVTPAPPVETTVRPTLLMVTFST